MNFRVTYTDRSGERKTEVLSAVDRRAAFSELAARGITPVSLVACGDSPSGASRAGRSPSGVWRGALAGSAVIVAALVSWLLISPDKEQTKPSDPPKKVAPTKSPVVTQSRPIEDAVTNRHQKAIQPSGQVAAKGAETAAATNAVPEAVAVKEKPAEAPGGIQYTTCTEQILGWIFSCPIGNAPMPLPNLPPKELENLEKILTTPNLVKEGDDDFVREQKEIIEQAKQEFKKFIDEGGKPKDFLNYYHDLLINYHDQFVDAQKAVLKAVREEDPELAREFFEKVNAQLAEKGIKQIKLSRKFSEKIGVEHKGKEKK